MKPCREQDPRTQYDRRKFRSSSNRFLSSNLGLVFRVTGGTFTFRQDHRAGPHSSFPVLSAPTHGLPRPEASSSSLTLTCLETAPDSAPWKRASCVREGSWMSMAAGCAVRAGVARCCAEPASIARVDRRRSLDPRLRDPRLISPTLLDRLLELDRDPC